MYTNLNIVTRFINALAGKVRNFANDNIVLITQRIRVFMFSIVND